MTDAVLLYVGGSKQAFRCSVSEFDDQSGEWITCGCNVFHKLRPNEYACNACTATYTTE